MDFHFCQLQTFPCVFLDFIQENLEVVKGVRFDIVVIERSYINGFRQQFRDFKESGILKTIWKGSNDCYFYIAIFFGLCKMTFLSFHIIIFY